MAPPAAASWPPAGWQNCYAGHSACWVPKQACWGLELLKALPLWLLGLGAVGFVAGSPWPGCLPSALLPASTGSECYPGVQDMLQLVQYSTVQYSTVQYSTVQYSMEYLMLK